MPHAFANNASTTLSQSITETSTTFYVQNGAGARFPSLSGGDFMVLTLEDANANVEIVKCTARVGDTFTISDRAYEDSATNPALAFPSGARIELRLTAGAIGEFLQRQDDVIDGGIF